MNALQFIKQQLFDFRLKKAIKKANEYHALTGNRFLVLLYKNKPIVKSKKNIKMLVATKRLRSTIQQIEQIALYITQ